MVTTWEWEKSLRTGEYYNLQRQNTIESVTFENGQTFEFEGHPLVVLKTLESWAPDEQSAKLIEEAPNMYNMLEMVQEELKDLVFFGEWKNLDKAEDMAQAIERIRERIPNT